MTGLKNRRKERVKETREIERAIDNDRSAAKGKKEELVQKTRK